MKWEAAGHDCELFWDASESMAREKPEILKGRTRAIRNPRHCERSEAISLS
jgi:hypothetical protein